MILVVGWAMSMTTPGGGGSLVLGESLLLGGSLLFGRSWVSGGSVGTVYWCPVGVVTVNSSGVPL